MRSTLIRVSSQFLQITVNSRPDFSGNDPPSSLLDVPVDLFPEVGEAPEHRAWRYEALRQEQVAVRPCGEWSGRNLCSKEPELRAALSTVGSVVVCPPQGIRQRLDEPQAASDLGWIGGAKPVHEDSELKTADR